MKISRLDHVQLAIPVGREDEARAFYDAILGIPEKPKPPDLAKRGGAWFENDAVKIHVGVDADFRPATKAHPALVVSDLPTFIEHLRRSGVDVDDEDLPRYRRVYVSDPFGNRLELIDEARGK